MTTNPEELRDAWSRHDRTWRSNLFVYPVVSRRSGGISVGINLNPDKACNFDCVYCQVDRGIPPAVRRVDLSALSVELDLVVAAEKSGSLYDSAPFSALPPGGRGIRDFAFSGDGEPTTSPVFGEAVAIVAGARLRHGLTDAKLVLITDAAYLQKPTVAAALAEMDRNNGEIWAKLDAGTEEYFRAVDRPNVSLATVLDNIVAAARVRPVVIQSLWMRLHGEVPPQTEVEAFCARLNEILRRNGKLQAIQVYTVARRTAEAYVAPLDDRELDSIASTVRHAVPVRVETYYGTNPSA